MSMMRFVPLAAAALALSACMTNPVPQGYDGPLASIADSTAQGSTTGLDFFFLEKVNGKDVENSLADTVQANEGQGFSMTPRVIRRPVPAASATFTITGRTHYAAPILELTNKVYQVSGNVTFAPLPDHTYEVKGSLREHHSAVWIEDTATGAVVDKKIEIDGSAALGFFSK